MRQRTQRVVRRGATAVESAIAYLATFMLILGLIIGGVGIFRYQEVAALAREAARYASVRGADYQEETGKTAATEAEVETFVKSKAVGMDKSKLTATPIWSSKTKAVWTPITDNGRAIGSTVSVTVSYQWLPELWIAGPITLTSKSTMQICY